MTTIHDILAEFREAATSKRDMGDKFERLFANFLVIDPQYQDRFSDVWMWSEWRSESSVMSVTSISAPFAARW
jgi:predicted helicase